jgi:soluble lytic murein transglycosylase-like protein
MRIFGSKPMTTLSNLITALIAVESAGNDLAIGDNGRAIGPLQIHRGVVQDVNRFTGSHYRWESMTNRVQARAVCAAYLTHYSKSNSSKQATIEELARRWNGGPTGDRKAATVGYWKKVKKEIK